MNVQSPENNPKKNRAWLAWLLPVLAWPAMLGVGFFVTMATGDMPPGSSEAREFGRALAHVGMTAGVFLTLHIVALVIACRSAKTARMHAATGFATVIFSLACMAYAIAVVMSTAAELAGSK